MNSFALSGAALHRPAVFPLPAFVVKALFGEMGESLLLASARVQPAKLQASGFPFAHPDWTKPCAPDLAAVAAIADESNGSESICVADHRSCTIRRAGRNSHVCTEVAMPPHNKSSSPAPPDSSAPASPPNCCAAGIACAPWCAGSESRVLPGCEIVHGDALRAETYASNIAPADTFVHLVGVAHPSPSKAEEFREIDLRLLPRRPWSAAKQAGIRHFVYLSVARPAPMMKAYQAVRAEGEAMVIASGIPATFVRPWYVLGPGRSWPRMLQPFYAMARLLPADTRWREPSRAGHPGANDADAGVGGGESAERIAECSSRRRSS